jgi:hypothetical protein
MLQKIYWLDYCKEQEIKRRFQFQTIFCKHRFPLNSNFYNRAFMLFDGGAISTTYSWTVSINNCSTTRVGSVVTSADEITEQIRRLLILKMNFFFGKSPNEVEQYCNLQHSIGSEISAIDILPDFFIDKPVDLSERIRDLDPWIEKVLSLDRQTYKSLCKALAAYEKALHILSSDPTLSYSLLIFVLESLSNSESLPEYDWQDLGNSEQRKFNKLFEDNRFSSVDSAWTNDIKQLILETLKTGANKRFTEFTVKHIPVSFYESQNTTSKSPIRSSKIYNSIKKAYSLRSTFAHQLKPLSQYLISESRIAEEVEEDGETYLTPRGLFRLVRSVVLEFIEKQEIKKLHSYHWDNELNHNIISGSQPVYDRVRKSNGQLFPIESKYAKKWFEDILTIYQDNYVEHLHKRMHENSESVDWFCGIGTSGSALKGRLIFRFDPSPSYEWKIWREQSLNLISHAKRKLQGYLRSIAILCAHLEEIEDGKSRMLEVIESEKFGTASLNFENFVVSVICNMTQQWTGEEAEKLLEEHLENRKILLPTRVEIACMVEVARLFQHVSMNEGREKWLAYAYKDAARYPDFQIVVKSALESDDIIVETQAILHVPQYPSLVDSYNALTNEDYW